jgi:hypothetical protein
MDKDMAGNIVVGG